MSKTVLRYLGANSCELYRLRAGKLSYMSSGSLQDLATNRVDSCILGPRQFIWSSINANEIKFEPDADIFLFSDATIMQLDEIEFLPAFRSHATDEWTQIWIDRGKLSEIQSALPSAKVLYPEITSVAPPEGVDVWMAGKDIYGRIQQDFVHETSSNPNATLDGFTFHKNTSGFQRDRASRKRGLLAAVLTVCIALLPWVDIFKSALLPAPADPVIYENKIDIDTPMKDLTAVLTGIELDRLEMNVTSNTLVFTLSEDQAWSDRKIEEIQQVCKRINCRVIPLSDSVKHRLTLELRDRL